MRATGHRNLNLDLARGVAAILVFTGHLFLSRFQDLIPSPVVERFSTGAMCVSFFFMLSGYVLALNQKKVAKSKWILSRLVRLMPIYYVAWSVPLIGLLVTKSEYIPNEAGIIRGAFAAQSFSQFHFLDQPNPPLWSLSIEIYLTFFFIYSVNFKRWCLTLICVAIFFMNSQDNFLSQTPFFSGLPMFLLGIILAKQKLILSKRTNTLLGIILFFVYLTCAPYFVHGTELVTGSRNLFVVAVMVWLINLGRLQKARNFASYLGQRSYSLYAIHWPLMFFLDHIFSSLSTAPELLKLISFLILIAVAVEVTYRTVEVPAVVISRRILQTK